MARVIDFREAYAEETLLFHLLLLREASYVWVGSEEARLDALAVAVPSAYSAVPSGSMLMGADAAGSSQAMAQRLSRKLGQPCFVSLDVRDDPDLHFFVQRRVLEALRQQGEEAAGEGGGGTAAAAAAAAAAGPPIEGMAAVRLAGAKAVAPEAHAPAAASRLSDEGGVGSRSFSVLSSAAELGDAAAEALLHVATQAIATRGAFFVALSGGSIPSLLAQPLLARSSRANFGKWHVFLADERMVAEESAESNMGTWKRMLLAEAGVPPTQLHSVDPSLPLPEAAQAYEAHLRATLGATPRLDAVVLGVGADGHTASLFPGHALLDEEDAWVASLADAPKPPAGRVTLTRRTLAHAAFVLFVACGGEKAEAVRRAHAPEPDVPAGWILGRLRTLWLLDAHAAAQLVVEEEKLTHMYG